MKQGVTHTNFRVKLWDVSLNNFYLHLHCGKRK